MTSSTQEEKIPICFCWSCALCCFCPATLTVKSTLNQHSTWTRAVLPGVTVSSSHTLPRSSLARSDRIVFKTSSVFVCLFLFALSTVQRLSILITWLFPRLISITCLANVKINPCFQRVDDDDDDGGKTTVYNTVGPNVCMGDHKVKTGLLFSSGGSEPSLQGPEPSWVFCPTGETALSPGPLVGLGPWRTELRRPCCGEQMHSFPLFLFSPHSQCSCSSP